MLFISLRIENLRRLTPHLFLWSCFPVTCFLLNENARSEISAISPVERPIKLFNGEDLTGLYTWLLSTKCADPKRVFRVHDQLLHITGDGLGSVITKRRYRDYHMVLEYKWGDRTWGERKKRARDSGLLIHSTGKNGGYHGIWMPAIEVQIIEGGVGDFILVTGEDEQGAPVPLSLTSRVSRHANGEVVWNNAEDLEVFNLDNLHRVNWRLRDPHWQDEMGFRGKRDPDSPKNEWTKLEVICDKQHVQVFVNGTIVNEAFNAYPSEGHIQVQSELAEIFVRRWELLPLEDRTEAAQTKE